MKVDQMGWSGMKVGRYVLGEQVGAGAFSYAYLATDPVTGKKRVLKFAKTVPPEFEVPHESKALMFGTGCMYEVAPDPVALLRAQFDKLRLHPDSTLPSVDELVEQYGYWHYRMEYIEGKTLRQLLHQQLQLSHKQLLEIFAKLCTAMEDLLERGTFMYHGDLKPDNVMIDNQGVRLLDPGYFGPMQTEYGMVDPCIITTPHYYPTMTADDMMAVGLMMWETFCHQHPLATRASTDTMDRSMISDELYQWARGKELVGQFYASPLLCVLLPAEVDEGISFELEAVLLKAVHLKVRKDGLRDFDRGYENFAEMRGAIEALI